MGILDGLGKALFQRLPRDASDIHGIELYGMAAASDIARPIRVQIELEYAARVISGAAFPPGAAEGFKKVDSSHFEIADLMLM